MRIVITGAGGQLGRALQEALAGDEVAAFPHSVLDITDSAAVAGALGRSRPDLVINAAAWTDTAACEADPRRALAINAEAPGYLALECRRLGAALLQVSSNEVFDGEKGVPYEEDDEPRPINHYGRSKLEGERRVQEALERHYIVRTSWLFGAGRASFPEKVLDAARRQGSLRLVTDEVASPTWTKDLAEAIARLIRHEAWGTYHLTNSGSCSRMEFGEEVLRLAGLQVPVFPTSQKEFGLPYRKPLDSTLANRRAAALGITMRPWQQALASHLGEGRVAASPASPSPARPGRGQAGS